MLTCEICGEDFLLEEDLQTHLLLSHEESTMSCPLCSLSGVSYDELCLHISSAHAEGQSPKRFRSADPKQKGRDQDVDEFRSAHSKQRDRDQDVDKSRSAHPKQRDRDQDVDKSRSAHPKQRDRDQDVDKSRSAHPKQQDRDQDVDKSRSAHPKQRDRDQDVDKSRSAHPKQRDRDQDVDKSRSAHPKQRDRDQDVDKSRSALGCSEGSEAADTKFSLTDPCRASGSCLTAATAPGAVPGVETDSGEPGHVCSSPGETATIFLSSQRPKTRPEPSSYSKAKQKLQSSPRHDHQLLSCPMCALVCRNSFLLQEHVELHLTEQGSPEGSTLQVRSPAVTSSSGGTSSAERRFECPLCSVLCTDSFSLQEHVELHLDHGAAGHSGAAGSPDSDLELAQQLQREEDQKRRQEEAWQEREDFKKLQRQFGVDGSGGYSRQMERTMERDVARGLMNPAEFHRKRAEMMETMASGVDDGRTRTQGVIRALYEFYQTDCRDCVHVWLSAETDHFCSSPGDKGWGCGYRNLQMMLSCLHRTDAYAPILQERTVPSIPQVQRMIEEAWREGLDAQGASHFNHRLHGTRAWIGATEIYSLLTSLRISAHIVDFHQPTGPGDTHPRLFEWVKKYFCQSSSNKLPPRLIKTSLPPLYLQHQGHSRSIVGLEQRRNGSLCLLLLDPASSVSETRKLLSRDSIGSALRHIRKYSSSLKHKQYQVVALQGVLSAEEKQISILKSRTLCAERIP